MLLNHPLRFQPLLRRYLWGGRRLETLLKKPLGEGADYAESWEVVDHGNDQSVVAFGPFAKQTLRQLVQEQSGALLGRHAPQATFPLLFKFLDANQPLSVQVHPNDEYGALMTQPDLGKTEAWVVVHAEPGARLYAGLKRGFDRAALAREVARGTTELCLHQFEPQVGDCVFIPAGVAHALGAGLVIAEIQQASDTTFRLYDWNRVGADGQPRALHIEQALEVIDYAYGPVAPQVAETVDPQVQRLVACDKFVLDRWQLNGSRAVGGDDRFHILAVLAGEIRLPHDPAGQTLKLGETALLPAALPPGEILAIGNAVVLDMYLPG
ncbi:MAG TPA: type I phosphomannose isomerase catalytic subunit [Pirellulaceae bacterium]|nr:type I phosphomannose isomerase catalytic subunit [Pirellulaceae bacterium]